MTFYTRKPVFLLDVDGVINACPWDEQFPETHPEETWNLVYGTALGRQWPIRYSSVVIDRINRLSERVEVRWHTTWQTEAPGLGELLGLNAFKVEDHSKYNTHKSPEHLSFQQYAWWKMQAGINVLSVEKRPLIWADDDLSREHRVLTEAEAEENGLPICLVSPSTECGLTTTELDEIEYFIENCEGSSGASSGSVGV